MTPILLNATAAVSVRIVTPAVGAWFADVDLDLGADGGVPSGAATLAIGSTIMQCTVDPEASGKFGTKAKVRVVGGRNGWQKLVDAQHFHNDFGVLSSNVFAVTAAAVGETVVDATPTRLGADFVRTAGPASRVLSGFAWYVDTSGVTVIGPRPPIPQPLGLEVLAWHPTSRRAEIASDELVLPGTVLVEPRFGSAVVQDVEQTFGADGARAVAWCKPPDAPEASPPGVRLARALAALARESTGVQYLRRYAYRITSQAADRLNLQAVDKTDAPAFLQSVEVWAGSSGYAATYAPGTEAHVVFVDGDPAQPVVVGFAKSTPTKLELDGVQVVINKGVQPAARMGDAVLAGPFAGTITSGSATTKIG